jgi:hypothetical protein
VAGVVQVKDLSVSSYAEQVLQVAKLLREAGPLLAVTDFFLAAHTNQAGQELGNISLAELPRERMLVLVWIHEELQPREAWEPGADVYDAKFTRSQSLRSCWKVGRLSIWA